MAQQTNSNLTPKNPLGFKIGIHYAWIIIFIAAFIHMTGGSIRQAFGVLIVPLQTEMGWSFTAITLGYSIASLTGAFLAPFTGMATDRFGARPVIMIGAVFFLLGAIITGLVTEVWHIWISYGLCLGVAQACFNVPNINCCKSVVPKTIRIRYRSPASIAWTRACNNGNRNGRTINSSSLDDCLLGNCISWGRNIICLIIPF